MNAAPEEHISPAYTLQLPSAMDSLRDLENFCEEIREKLKIDQEKYVQIIVSLTEAVNNAIVHGNKMSPGKKVFLNLELEENKLVFTIADEGNGFDFRNLPDPTLPENLEREMGRGVFLMKNLADQVIFSENGSTVELHFRI